MDFVKWLIYLSHISRALVMSKITYSEDLLTGNIGSKENGW